MGKYLISRFCFYFMTVHGFCEADEFRCANGSCIAQNKVRDGVVDCYGGRFDESK